VVKKPAKILIAAGGTGGHLFPGIAIAEEIKGRHPEAMIVFAGTERGLEAGILPKLNWPLVLMNSTSIKDRKGLGKIVAWAKLPVSLARAMIILVSESPRLVVCVGGYAAGPLAMASWLFRIPFVIVEPNAIAGFTNRVLGRFARRAFVAFEEARSYFPEGRAFLTGNPVRKQVLAARRETSGTGDGKLTLFIFGGSQGAVKINRAMVDALKFLAETKNNIRVIHQTGTNDDAGTIERAYTDAGFTARVFPFSDRIWECYTEADLVVARSGATTVAELAALAIPSILVPYPFAADDHQRANARGMVRIGGAKMLENDDCTGENLAREIKQFMDKPQALGQMRAVLKDAGRPDAAGRIAEECWNIISA
jgi:UDP-N-acetylglucosamine--N-acetylmuramyl-(pentapeptide) pyrophosphoryl-undecaprenol N-acetylglucosamine transferase